MARPRRRGIFHAVAAHEHGDLHVPAQHQLWTAAYQPEPPCDADREHGRGVAEEVARVHRQLARCDGQAVDGQGRVWSGWREDQVVPDSSGLGPGFANSEYGIFAKLMA